MATKSWKYRRLFEVLPGAFVWLILITPLALAYWAPVALAVFMVFFLSYWLVRSLFMSAMLVRGFRTYKRDMKLSWRDKLDEIDPEGAWKDLYHLVIVPTYKEDISILRASVESVIKSTYPMDKVIYVLAIEERDLENSTRIAETLKKEYKDKVHDFIYTVHPKDIPGEVIGKGPNITFAGKAMVSYFAERKISPEKIIVTTMDADNVFDRQYLACLTCKYIVDPDPIHKSFQPLPMYFNNIWDVPRPMRLIAMGSSAWQMIVAMRPSRLKNFSAHAQSFEALLAVDFWSTKTIVEDGHQFWRTYYAFDGCHEVVPMSIPIYQDAVLGDNLKDTLQEQYLQKKRWAWGVSDIPFVMEHTIGNKKIPFIDRWSHALILWEAHLSWSTTSIVLATSSWLPLALNQDFKNTVLAYSFPIVYTRLVMVAWLGMVTTLIITSCLVPPFRGKKPVSKIVFDWLLTPVFLPISNILFSSIPALESQTRLMTGKYLDVFRVTKKSTKRSNI